MRETQMLCTQKTSHIASLVKFDYLFLVWELEYFSAIAILLCVSSVKNNFFFICFVVLEEI